ncbi:hypothetical protein Agub_g14133, partial [Astrephomene gubernaculifera]
MAAQPAPTSESAQFELAGHLRRKFHLGPRNWGRFKAAAAESDAEGYVPRSGAHVTLRDLARDPSTLVFPSNDDPAVRAALSDDGGWVGTPDPTKFAPGTSHLGPRELQEELDKGNVMLWKDFKRRVSELQGSEAEEVAAAVQQRLMQERMFVTLKDGSKVSLWDLQQYVQNNPEMEALLQRGRRLPTADPTDPAGRPLPPEPVSGLERSGALDVALVEPREAEEAELDWAHVGSGSVWRRRPTRWLGGLDGVRDWHLELYVHEGMTNQVLGRKYGSRDPYAVLRDPRYAADVVRVGPLVGLTLVLTAARELPLREAASTWRDLLSSYLQRQAPLQLPRRLRPTLVDATDLNGATWPALFDRSSSSSKAATRGSPQAGGKEEQEFSEEAGCDELGVSWRQMGAEEHRGKVAEGLELLQSLPELLCPPSSSSSSSPPAGPLAGSALVDGRGARWREGSSLWLTLEPEGGIVVQAHSPGPLHSRESYLLARLAGQEALAGALAEAALGPQPLDPQAAEAARSLMLLPANGFSAGNKEGDPNHPMLGWVPHPAAPPSLRPRPSAFRLAPEPAAAAGGQQRPGWNGTLLTGIHQSRVAAEVRGLLASAFRAADRAAAEVDTAAAGEAGDEAAAAAAAEGAAATATDDAGTVTVTAAARRRQAAAQAAAVHVLREGMRQLGPDSRRAVRQVVAEAVASG